jgi:hypothetical protein
MPHNQKLPIRKFLPHAGATVIASLFTILLAMIGIILSFFSHQPSQDKTATPNVQGTVFPTPTITPTSTPNAFYTNRYPTDGIHQPIVIDSIKDNMDMLESMFGWGILVALAIGWAGIIKQGDIEIIGVKVKRKYAFYLVATLYLAVNFALIILFVRLGELLLLLDNANFIDGLSKVTVHTWLLNPYSFFGYSIMSRSFSSLGYGLLIFCWWICYTSLFLLRDGQETITTKTLPILFLVLGLLALIVIDRNYSIISLRLANVNPEFHNALIATRTERTIVGLVGIGLGVSFFIFSVNMQSRLAVKPSSKAVKSLSKKDDLVYCPKCNLPFKTKDSLSIHLENWHTEQDEKN